MRAYTLIDLFCGAGGMSMGFCLTGRFQLLAGIDSNELALRTLYANHRETPCTFSQPSDVKGLSGQGILAELGVDSVDVVVGGPPCQGFSVAGRREASDARNELVWDYLRLIGDLRPSAFLMENVPGLLLAKENLGERLTDVLLDRFRQLGYSCDLWKLNAVDYGVPQVRKRAFIVGTLSGPTLHMPAPITPAVRDLFTCRSAPITVDDALSDLPAPLTVEPQAYESNAHTEYQEYLREDSVGLYNHTPSVHKPEMVLRLRAQAPGTRLYSNWNHAWYKLDPSRPATTVKENHRAPFVHPREPRVTTPRECARLQSFPDRYVFYGTKTAQLMQIGNAVPPLLAKAIALQIASALDSATVREARAAY